LPLIDNGAQIVVGDQLVSALLQSLRFTSSSLKRRSNLFGGDSISLLLIKPVNQSVHGEIRVPAFDVTIDL
jgi:hypothetical protein